MNSKLQIFSSYLYIKRSNINNKLPIQEQDVIFESYIPLFNYFLQQEHLNSALNSNLIQV